jgi:hypothetical protein
MLTWALDHATKGESDAVDSAAAAPVAQSISEVATMTNANAEDAH